MKRSIFALILLIAFGLSFTGCAGTPCEQVADLTVDECGVEPAEGEGEDEGEEVACEGEELTAAECALDNPDAFCKIFEDPTSEEVEPYTSCIAENSEE